MYTTNYVPGLFAKANFCITFLKKRTPKIGTFMGRRRRHFYVGKRKIVIKSRKICSDFLLLLLCPYVNDILQQMLGERPRGEEFSINFTIAKLFAEFDFEWVFHSYS